MARYDWTDGDIATAARLDGLPGGVVGYVEGSTSNQSGISTEVDITGLTVTWTAESGRLYKVTMVINVSQATSTGLVTAVIANGASASQSTSNMTLDSGEAGNLVVVEFATGSGSTTRKGRISTSAGTVSVAGTSNRFAVLIAEDVGLA